MISKHKFSFSLATKCHSVCESSILRGEFIFYYLLSAQNYGAPGTLLLYNRGGQVDN